jgi:uncharacterized protein with ParB-like and HNH nuclease domain
LVKWETNSVKKFTEKIHEGKYFLPSIQREKFIWKTEQVTKLFDSLLRGYPIGVLLLWEIGKGTDIKKRRFVQDFKKDLNPSDYIDTSPINDDIFLVLDGQQRLQSFYIGLKGTYEEKELFFNVLSGREENEDGLLYEFEFFKKKENYFRDEDGKLWIKLKWIDWSKKFYNIVDLLKNEKNLEIKDSEKHQIEHSLSDLFEAITRDDKVTYFKIDEPDQNKILDIFVRVNSGGTPLSKADLLFSIIKLRWEKDAEQEFNKLIESLNDNGKFNFDVDFILKVCLVLTADKQQDVKYDVKNLKSEGRMEKIEQNWESIKDSIEKVVDLIKEFGINSGKLLPSLNALIPIIYYTYANKLKVLKEEDKEKIKKWLINALLSGAFSGQSDTALYLSKEAIDEAKSKEFPYQEIAERIATGTKGKKSVTVNENILNKIKYGDDESWLVLFLVYPYNKINFNALDKKGRPQQDHIFSQKELRAKRFNKEKIDDIGNIRLLSTYENQSKGSKPFKEWVENISEEERELHLLPDKKYWNDYEQFISERKKKMLEKIQISFIKKS